MREDTWNEMERDFADCPELYAGPVALEEIDAASAELGMAFPSDYREFLHRYGGGIVGAYRILGLRQAEVAGPEWSVVEVNKKLREDRYPGVDAWLVVSKDHAGNPFGIAVDGTVWISDHDFGEIARVADNFEEFLRRKCFEMPE